MFAFGKSLVFVAVICILGISPVLAALTNGNFEDGLNNWNPAGSISLRFNSETGTNFVVFEGSESSLTSTLTQGFTLDAGTQFLSFEMMLFPPEGDPGTDVFTASLFGAGFTDPVFYSLDDETPQNEFTSLATTVVNSGGRKTVTLDVSSLTAGGDTLVTLEFKLLSDDDGLVSTVELYEVSDSAVSVVPVPGAFALGLIGIGAVGLTRKLKGINRV